MVINNNICIPINLNNKKNHQCQKKIATVHTYPDGSFPSREKDGSDLIFAAYSTPNKPVYVLQMGKNQISFIVSKPNNNKTYMDIIYRPFFLTNEYPRANIRNLLKGSFSLIQYTKSNNFIKSLNSK